MHGLAPRAVALDATLGCSRSGNVLLTYEPVGTGDT